MFIYKLIFPTGEFYIGKTNNINTRFSSHCYKLRNGVHARKLQSIYDNTKNLPRIEILEETSQKEVDLKEIFWIDKLEATTKGLNTDKGGKSPNWGEDSTQALYTEDDYKAAVSFIAHTDMTLVQIAEELNISIWVIKGISNGSNHGYLRELLPEDYDKMLNKNGTRKTKQYREYPAIKAPNGEIYTITNLNKFCRDHKLNLANMHKVIQGQRKTADGGWKLA